MIHCKECGRQIETNSKFCNYCGNTVNQSLSKNVIERRVNFERHNEEIDDKSTPKVIELLKSLSVFFGIKYFTIIAYIVWLMLNFIILIVSDYSYWGDRFWPFDKRSTIKDYGLPEFLFFTMTPLFLLVIFISLRHFIQEQNKNSDQKSVKTKKKILRYDPEYEPRISLTLLGIILITNVSHFI